MEKKQPQFYQEANQKLISYFDKIHDNDVHFIVESERVLKIQPYFHGEKNQAATIEFLYPVAKSYSVSFVNVRKEIQGTFDYPENTEKLMNLSFEIFNYYSNEDSLILVGSQKNQNGKGYTDYKIYLELFDISSFNID